MNRHELEIDSIFIDVSTTRQCAYDWSQPLRVELWSGAGNARVSGSAMGQVGLQQRWNSIIHTSVLIGLNFTAFQIELNCRIVWPCSYRGLGSFRLWQLRRPTRDPLISMRLLRM